MFGIDKNSDLRLICALSKFHCMFFKHVPIYIVEMLCPEYRDKVVDWGFNSFRQDMCRALMCVKDKDSISYISTTS